MRSILVLLAAAALVITGCGDDDGETGATTSTEAPTTSERDVEPGDAVDSPAREAENAVNGFMSARVEGEGAEAFLTDEASTIFPDDIALYDVESYEVGQVLAADASSFEVTVEVTSDDGSTRTEVLFVGVGTVDGQRLPFAIRGGTVAEA